LDRALLRTFLGDIQQVVLEGECAVLGALYDLVRRLAFDSVGGEVIG
jgi:hypothetical protein